jgi:phage tail protein X
VRPALKDYIINLCDGIKITLPDDAVERSKQYALLRVRQMQDE